MGKVILSLCLMKTNWNSTYVTPVINEVKSFIYVCKLKRFQKESSFNLSIQPAGDYLDLRLISPLVLSQFPFAILLWDVVKRKIISCSFPFMYQWGLLRAPELVMELIKCFQSLLEFVRLQFIVFIVYSVIPICQPHSLKTT